MIMSAASFRVIAVATSITPVTSLAAFAQSSVSTAIEVAPAMVAGDAETAAKAAATAAQAIAEKFSGGERSVQSELAPITAEPNPQAVAPVEIAPPTSTANDDGTESEFTDQSEPSAIIAAISHSARGVGARAIDNAERRAERSAVRRADRRANRRKARATQAPQAAAEAKSALKPERRAVSAKTRAGSGKMPVSQKAVPQDLPPAEAAKAEPGVLAKIFNPSLWGSSAKKPIDAPTVQPAATPEANPTVKPVDDEPSPFSSAFQSKY